MNGTPLLFDVSYLAAFLGGMLTILPSCGPFILPAFFAIAFKEKDQLAKMIGIFFLGLLLTFIPLGLGVSFLVHFFIRNLQLVQMISGVLLILLGLATLFGWSLTIPTPFRHKDTPEKSDPLSILVFGMMFGIASGACTAPTFGAVLTLAAQQGISWHSFSILLIFAVGMIAPLMILALAWERIPQDAKMKFFRLGLRFNLPFIRKPRFIPFTNIIAALLFFALGVLFLSGSIHTFTSSDFFTDLSITLSRKILLL